MSLGNIIGAGALLASFIGGGWSYHLYIDGKKLDVEAAEIQNEQFAIQLAQSSIQLQVVAKESRLRDISAELDRLAVTEDSRPLTAIEVKRKQQLQAQYIAIVNELEKLL
jgi:hypothetical protein